MSSASRHAGAVSGTECYFSRWGQRAAPVRESSCDSAALERARAYSLAAPAAVWERVFRAGVSLREGGGASLRDWARAQGARRCRDRRVFVLLFPYCAEGARLYIWRARVAPCAVAQVRRIGERLGTRFLALVSARRARQTPHAIGQRSHARGKTSRVASAAAWARDARTGVGAQRQAASSRD